MELEKIYTQEDMDNITSKVKESTIAKYEKTHISVDAYKELESKYNDLLMKDKANEVKQVFIANNGNEKAFSDFLNSHKELLNVDAKQLSNSISEISKEKQWYFNNVPQIKNEFEITKSMLKTNNDDIIDGTLTSREWTKR